MGGLGSFRVMVHGKFTALDQPVDRGKWNSKKVRPIIQLIADFVNGFIESEQFEQCVELSGSGGQEGCSGRSRLITLKKLCCDKLEPFQGPRLQPVLILGLLLQQTNLDGVVKGSHHACDIHER